MNKNTSNVPKSVVIAFAVLVILGVVTYFVRKQGPGETATPGTASTGPALVQDAPPDTAVLSETRKEGSVYNCTVVGRIEGTVRQSTELEAYHPIFKGDIKSAWIVPWTTRLRAEVLKNDGREIVELRKFEEVRSVELMAPAELTQLTYDLDPKVNKIITTLASSLEVAYPGNPASQSMGAIIKSQEFNYAEIAKLTGIDERILTSQEAKVAGAARILDDFEGKSVEVALTDGRTRWVYAPDLPTKLTQALGRVNSLIDYSALPSPEIEVGGKVVLSNLLINEILPPELMKEILSDFDADLTLELTRTPDETVEDRRLNRYEGTGSLQLRRLDGNVHGRLRVDQADLWVDVTDPGNRYLHRLTLSAPLESTYLQSLSRFKTVSWDGDLKLSVQYEVDQIQ